MGHLSCCGRSVRSGSAPAAPDRWRDRVTQTDRLTPEAFAARIRALGFNPPQATLDEMYAALPHLDAMRDRLRRAYTYADEPAHVYAMKGEAR